MLTVTPPRRANGKWTARNGGLPYKVDTEDGDDMLRQSKKLDCTVEELLAAVAAVQAASTPAPVDDVHLEPLITGFNEDGSGDSAQYAELRHALAAGPDAIMTPPHNVRWSNFRWQDTTRLAALDVDVLVPGDGWGEHDMEQILQTPGPKPRYAWVTKSGGLRFIYGACKEFGLSAHQRAALASLLLDCCHSAKTEKVELLCYTARPPDDTLTRFAAPCDEYTVVDLRGALLQTGGADSVSEESIARYLGDKGLRRGQRYGHDRCPRDPGSSTGTDPVVVLPDGIYCHKGSCRGRWMPWSQLIGDRDAGEIEPMTKAALNRVHWQHARIVAKASRPLCGLEDDAMRRAGYEALLRVLHPEEEHGGIFRADLLFVRGDGGWLHSDTLNGYGKIGPSSVCALPWVGESGPRRDLGLSDAELDGYPIVEPVLWLIDKPTWDAERILVPRPVEKGDSIYQWDLEQAWRQLRQSLPGIPDEWLRLTRALTVAALLGQSAGHTPPLTIIHGPSGSGKGAAVQFVSGVLGVREGHLNFKDSAEMARSLGEALEKRCPQVFGDEIGKVEGWWTLSGVLLRAGDLVGWRKLFVGNVLTRNRSSVVLAGSTLPLGLLTMRELRRRAAVAELPRIDPERTAEWDGALAESLNITSLPRLRDSDVGVAIANAYIEDALRIYREATAQGIRKWPILAESIGLHQLGDDEESLALVAVVRRLYSLWISGECQVREGSRVGWLRCWFTGKSDEAAEAFSAWIHPDDPEKERRGKLGRLDTADAVSACRLPGDSQVQIRVARHGSRYYVRFSAGPKGSPMSREGYPPIED